MHAVTPGRSDFSILPTVGLDELAGKLDAGLDRRLAGDELAEEAYATLRARMPKVVQMELCLVHRDYWPANVLWQRGKVSAIIDWSSACIGDRRLDVSQARIDIALLAGSEAAAAFLADYEARLPAPLPDLWLFDLYLGLQPLGRWQDWWLPAYEDLGLQKEAELLLPRARDFVASALAAGASAET